MVFGETPQFGTAAEFDPNNPHGNMFDDAVMQEAAKLAEEPNVYDEIEASQNQTQENSPAESQEARALTREELVDRIMDATSDEELRYLQAEVTRLDTEATAEAAKIASGENIIEDLDRAQELAQDTDPLVKSYGEAALNISERPSTEAHEAAPEDQDTEPLAEINAIQTEKDQAAVQEILAEINGPDKNPPHEAMEFSVDSFTNDSAVVEEALQALGKNSFPIGARVGIMSNMPQLLEYAKSNPNASQKFADGIRAINRIQEGQA